MKLSKAVLFAGAIASTVCVSSLVAAAPTSAETSAPRIVSVSQNKASLPSLDAVTLTVGVAGSWSNPYDPDQIDIWAEVQTPAGRIIDVPAFYGQDYRISGDQVVPAGSPHWHVRYTPTETGRYVYQVAARSAESAVARSQVGEFEVTPAPPGANGFVRRDPDNGRYLRFDQSGKTLYPLGLNADIPEFTADTNHQADPTSRYHGILGDGVYAPAEGLTPANIYKVYSYYRDAIDNLAAAGGTSMRVILDSWLLPLELDPNAGVPGYPDGVPGFTFGRYNQANAWIVDQILSLAAQHGIYVTLVAFDAQHEWGAKAYAKPDVANRTLIERRLGYQAARWGYSPNVLAWELFNEAAVDPSDPFYASIVTWLREADPNHHLIFNSYNGVDEQETHTYLCGDGETDPSSDMYWPYCPAQTDFLSWAHFSTDPDPSADRPDLLSEYGEKWYFRLPADTDPDGTRAREGLWASLMGHHTGAQYWWTYTHLQPLNLYGAVYRGISRFLDGINLGDFDWQPAELEQASGPGGLTYTGMVENQRIGGAVDNAGDPRALLWFVRTPSDEYTDRAPANGNVVRLTGQQPGRYTIDWYDPRTGALIAEQDVRDDGDGGVALHVPDGVTRDIAAKVFGPEDATHLTVAPTASRFEPGQTQVVTASLVNTGEVPPPARIEFRLVAPTGWAVTAGSGATNAGPLPPGGVVHASWQVTAPDDVTPGSYTFVASASYSTGGQTRTVQQPFTVTALPLPLSEYGPVQAPYRTVAAGTAADFYQRDEQLAIVSGGTDMWTGADQYGAIYMADAATANATAAVKVSYQEAVDAKARAGLMMRNDISAPGSAAGYVVVGVTPQNGFVMNWDSDGNGYLDGVRTAAASNYPAWLRLTRSGTTYTGSFSLDGTTWQNIATVTLPSAAPTQDVGVFSTAHHSGVSGRTDFTGFTVTTG